MIFSHKSYKNYHSVANCAENCFILLGNIMCYFFWDMFVYIHTYININKNENFSNKLKYTVFKQKHTPKISTFSQSLSCILHTHRHKFMHIISKVDTHYVSSIHT